MKRLLMFVPTLFFSLVLHAAAVGVVMWTASGAPLQTQENNEVWLGDLEIARSEPRVVQRRPKPPPVQLGAPEVAAVVPSPDPQSATTEVTASARAVTASEIFELTSVQTHPYFLKLSKILNEAKRGLLPHDGHAEQFFVHIGIGGNGQVLGVDIAGDESRLKIELAERMARLGFLPALPKDIFLDREKIEIRYRVLFQYN